MELINGDCLLELKKLKDKSIDFVYLDLPYGQTACTWDKKLDHIALWVELKRIAKNDRTPFFFSCTTKFGFELYNTAPKGWFRWDLVWEKNRAAGFLNAYKLPMRKHEMVYCFAKKTPEYDVSSHKEFTTQENKNNRNDLFSYEGSKHKKELTAKLFKDPLPTSVLPPQEDHELVYCFAQKTPEYDVSSHLTGEEFEKPISSKDKFITEICGGNLKRFDKPHIGKVLNDPLPTSVLPPQEDHELVYCFAQKTPDYDVSSHSEYTEETGRNKEHKIETYGKKGQKCVNSKTHKDPLPTSILPPQEDHELVYCFAKKTPEYDVSSHSEYTEDKRPNRIQNDIYGKVPNVNRKTHKDPLPTSVLDIPSSWCKYKLDEGINHRTSKPVKLMEFLLKYWSKEGDTVLDPTAGSGSMGCACINMNRKFIGIEKDPDIFAIMKDRLDKHKKGEKVIIKPKKKPKKKI